MGYAEYHYLRNSPYRDDWQLANAREPEDIDVLPLGTRRVPFWWPINYNAQNGGTLQIQETSDQAIVPSGNFVLCKLLAIATQPKGFRSQFRQSIDNNGNGFNFSRIGIEQSNAFGMVGDAGVPEAPFTLPIPYAMPNLLSLLNRTANKSIVTDPNAGVNDVQLVLFGMREAPYEQD